MLRHMPGRRQILLAVTSVILLIFLLVSSACVCDPAVRIDVHNQTDQTLGIFIGKTYQGDVSPGEIKSITTMEIWGDPTPPWGDEDFLYIIEAKTKEGEVVYSELFTWYELDDMNWTIVIPPPEEATEVDSASPYIIDLSMSDFPYWIESQGWFFTNDLVRAQAEIPFTILLITTNLYSG